MMKPVVLTILDGWGYSPQQYGNAILYASTPFLDSVQRYYPSLLLQASGKAVGMTWGEAGNSEVGHLSLGAGRIIFQYLSKINKAIGDGSFFQNEAFLKALNHAKNNGSTLHLAGLLTSGSVHAHMSHLFALVDLAAKNNFGNVRLHLFTDGKDSKLKESPLLIQKLQEYLDQTGVGSIMTVIGRDLAMDRDKNWDKTGEAYKLLVNGAGEEAENIIQKIQTFYKLGHTDSNLPPMTTDRKGFIRNNDALIFFNFREDSMRQLTRSFVERNFPFPTEQLDNLLVVSMTQYLDDPRLNVAFPHPEVKNNLAEVLSQSGKKQLHIAETEKYAHVTYFFNGLNNAPFPGETDVFIESLKDSLNNPQMKALEISDKVTESINQDQYDSYIINFANADILAHTGNIEATIRGVTTVDAALNKIADAVLAKGGIMLITADHGNAESMLYESSGEQQTIHDESPVPLYLVGNEFKRDRSVQERERTFQIDGILADVAPTVLALMGIEQPAEMTGENLLEHLK
ncbi:MAG: 2,3-bisphosphoglycerate-independent phosphoglycerate mutase [Candidatus Paceibacterota bacterium]